MRRARREADPPLTEEVIAKIEALRVRKGWSREKLADHSGMSLRRIQDWLGTPGLRKARSGTPFRPRLENIACVAKSLGVVLDELIASPDPQAAGAPSRQHGNFETAARIAREVDQELIEVTRRLSTGPIQAIRTAYRRVLNDGLRERGYDLRDWIRMLEDPGTQNALAQSLPSADLAVEVGQRFDSLVFRLADGRRIGLKKPALLWDCACETPDSMAKAEDCPVHGDPLGGAVKAAFFGGMVEITWRGIVTRWRDERDLWPPAVDTFSFLLELERVGVLDEDCPSVLDLGNGTGLLGIAFAKMNTSVSRIVLPDWLLTPSLYGALNWALNRKGRERVTLEIKVGMFSDWMIEAPSAIVNDVVLCNPPYLPLLPGFEQFGVHAVVAGTELLSHVVQHASLLGRRVFLQFSHLARKDAQTTADAHRARLDPLSSETRLVPFRVRRAWSEVPEYFGAPRSMKEGLVAGPAERHPYWHSIQVYEVNPRPLHDRLDRTRQFGPVGGR